MGAAQKQKTADLTGLEIGVVEVDAPGADLLCLCPPGVCFCWGAAGNVGVDEGSQGGFEGMLEDKPGEGVLEDVVDVGAGWAGLPEGRGEAVPCWPRGLHLAQPPFPLPLHVGHVGDFPGDQGSDPGYYPFE